MAEQVMASKQKYQLGKHYKHQKATSATSGSKKKNMIHFTQPCIHRIPTLVMDAGTGKKRFVPPDS